MIYDSLIHYYNNIQLLKYRTRTSSRHQINNIGYIGAQGCGNLGDEAVYQATATLMRGKSVIPIAQPRMEHALCKLNLAGPSFFRAVILGGGTLINDIWLPQVTKIVSQGIPIFALGTGVGSCGSIQAEIVDIRHWDKPLGNFMGIGVRGPLSRNRLEEMGIENVEIVGDTALYLSHNIGTAERNSGKFVVNLAGPKRGINNTTYVNTYNECVKAVSCLVNKDFIPVPIAMSIEDIIPLNELMQAVNLYHVPILLASTTEQFFDIASACDFTVAVRLHAAILSTCIGLPTILFGYRDKCLDFMMSMGLDEWHIALDDNSSGKAQSLVIELANQPLSTKTEILNTAMGYKKRIESYVDRMLCRL